MARMRWVVCVFALLWPTSAWSASEVPASIPRLRPLGGRAAEMLERGTAQSPTFRDLVARLGQSDVVVYVNDPRISPVRPTPLAGCTRWNGLLLPCGIIVPTVKRPLEGQGKEESTWSKRPSPSILKRVYRIAMAGSPVG